MADVVVAETPIEIPKENEEIVNAVSPDLPDLHKQQSEDKTTNSHHHDSEYDTANYDTSDDEEDVSLEEEDDDCKKDDGDQEDLSSTGSEDGDYDDDVERKQMDGQEQIDLVKKVDEDRSNPQYIPKKGTFYEHDDRTAEEPERTDLNVAENTEGSENNLKVTAPTISTASKTMKKWQAASVGRWSHDRFEETEQAPKSRSELVSAYGYDIRNEDGPPRARRRRRYGRGPTKYNRNWEDESAYIKSNNSQRKQLRPEDFPVLGDRKVSGKSSRTYKEEKENHYENRKSSNQNRNDDTKRSIGGRNIRPGNRRSNEFQNRPRSNYNSTKKTQFTRQTEKSHSSGDNSRSNLNNDDVKKQMETLSFTNAKVSNTIEKSISIAQHQQLQNNEHFNNGYENFHSNMNHNSKRELSSDAVENAYSSQQQNNNDNQINNINSKLNSRIHMQPRNEPSHVGSVQMHSLVSPKPNLIQTVTELHQSVPLEQGKPKRYSNLRQRSTNDTPIHQQGSQMDKMNLQQIHMQREPAHHVLLYHQKEQAPIQGSSIQNIPKNGPPPPQFSQNPVSQQYPPGNAYYSGQPNEYAPNPSAPSGPIMQLSAAAYMQQQQSSVGSPVTNTQPPPPINFVPPPTNPPSGPSNAPAAAPYPNYPPQTGTSSQYPNYNTVGGTTYFVPHAQPPQRTNALPQRRPTNAIPILAPPSDKNKQQSNTLVVDQNQIGSAENIDHILDNMFVQRAPYMPPQNPALNPNAPINDSSVSSTNEADVRVTEAVKNLNLNENDSKPTESIVETQSSSQENLSTTPDTVTISNVEASVTTTDQPQTISEQNDG